eukprot:358597-Chlamydomonas_euryale.AAC.5
MFVSLSRSTAAAGRCHGQMHTVTLVTRFRPTRHYSSPPVRSARRIAESARRSSAGALAALHTGPCSCLAELPGGARAEQVGPASSPAGRGHRLLRHPRANFALARRSFTGRAASRPAS